MGLKTYVPQIDWALHTTGGLLAVAGWRRQRMPGCTACGPCAKCAWHLATAAPCVHNLRPARASMPRGSGRQCGTASACTAGTRLFPHTAVLTNPRNPLNRRVGSIASLELRASSRHGGPSRPGPRLHLWLPQPGGKVSATSNELACGLPSPRRSAAIAGAAATAQQQRRQGHSRSLPLANHLPCAPMPTTSTHPS